MYHGIAVTKVQKAEKKRNHSYPSNTLIASESEKTRVGQVTQTGQIKEKVFSKEKMKQSKSVAKVPRIRNLWSQA